MCSPDLVIMPPADSSTLNRTSLAKLRQLNYNAPVLKKSGYIVTYA